MSLEEGEDDDIINIDSSDSSDSEAAFEIDGRDENSAIDESLTSIKDDAIILYDVDEDIRVSKRIIEGTGHNLSSNSSHDGSNEVGQALQYSEGVFSQINSSNESLAVEVVNTHDNKVNSFDFVVKIDDLSAPIEIKTNQEKTEIPDDINNKVNGSKRKYDDIVDVTYEISSEQPPRKQRIVGEIDSNTMETRDKVAQIVDDITTISPSSSVTNSANLAKTRVSVATPVTATAADATTTDQALNLSVSNSNEGILIVTETNMTVAPVRSVQAPTKTLKYSQITNALPFNRLTSLYRVFPYIDPQQHSVCDACEKYFDDLGVEATESRDADESINANLMILDSIYSGSGSGEAVQLDMIQVSLHGPIDIEAVTVYSEEADSPLANRTRPRTREFVYYLLPQPCLTIHDKYPLSESLNIAPYIIPRRSDSTRSASTNQDTTDRPDRFSPPSSSSNDGGLTVLEETPSTWQLPQFEISLQTMPLLIDAHLVGTKLPIKVKFLNYFFKQETISTRDMPIVLSTQATVSPGAPITPVEGVSSGSAGEGMVENPFRKKKYMVGYIFSLKRIELGYEVILLAHNQIYLFYKQGFELIIHEIDPKKEEKLLHFLKDAFVTHCNKQVFDIKQQFSSPSATTATCPMKP